MFPAAVGHGGARLGQAIAILRPKSAEATRWLLIAVGGYLASHAAGLLALATWPGRQIELPHLLATRADAGWFLGIAQHGYDTGQGQNLAFFPLYPGLVSGTGRLLGWGVYPGLVVAWLAGLAAAAGLFMLGRAVVDAPTGAMLAILWAALPLSVVQVMGYSETLFVALAAWSLWALVRRRWLTAALLCAGAGLTRASALPLIVVLVADAALTMARGPRSWRPVAAAILAPAGMLGYLAWVAVRTGRLDGWQHIQETQWHQTWSWGTAALREIGHVLTATELPLKMFLVTLTVVAALLLAALSLLDRQPWPVTIFGLGSLALAVGSTGYFHATARFLLAAFPLLLPLARALAATSVPRRLLVLVTLVAFSAWSGSYVLLVWRWSP